MPHLAHWCATPSPLFLRRRQIACNLLNQLHEVVRNNAHRSAVSKLKKKKKNSFWCWQRRSAVMILRMAAASVWRTNESKERSLNSRSCLRKSGKWVAETFFFFKLQSANVFLLLYYKRLWSQDQVIGWDLKLNKRVRFASHDAFRSRLEIEHEDFSSGAISTCCVFILYFQLLTLSARNKKNNTKEWMNAGDEMHLGLLLLAGIVFLCCFFFVTFYKHLYLCPWYPSSTQAAATSSCSSTSSSPSFTTGADILCLSGSCGWRLLLQATALISCVTEDGQMAWGGSCWSLSLSPFFSQYIFFQN